MESIDWVVLVGYFVVMAGIGFWSMLKIKKQEDYFLGGRSFGRILQAFAAFGAGTGSNDPVTLGTTIFRSGLSGIWSVLLWLWVTPFYWIFGVWYRRMRHITLGDWFVERYESPAMGAAYTAFGIVFYMMYLSVGFSAVGKVCVPLMDTATYDLPGIGVTPIEQVLVPVIALVVALYGALGGLRAAYWTDLIQGVFIILLSVMLIPAGLDLLVQTKGDPATMSTIDGFAVMHQQVPAENFQVIGGVRSSEFPIYYIAAIVLINMVGIVVQPHFIATGGGSAKSENSARVGLVAGNFMKRFCTVGWALTALIVLALYADNVNINENPDTAWGVASREILGQYHMGLVGLMLACLLAALMSSADCYMLVSSALVVRNLYVPYVNPDASEKECILAGRITGVVILVGAAIVSLYFMNVFEQLKITWEMPILFAAPFWIGMFWRRASKWGAWLTVLFSLSVFFLIPMLAPKLMPELQVDPSYTIANDKVVTTVTRPAAPSDASKRQVAIEQWEKKQQGQRPEPLAVGEMMTEEYTRGGTAVFWSSGLSKLVDTEEAAQAASVSADTISEARESGTLNGHKIGDDYYYDRESLQAWKNTASTPQEVEKGEVVIPAKPFTLSADDYTSGDPQEMPGSGDGKRTVTEVRSQLKSDVHLYGLGNFNLYYLLYQVGGMNLTQQDDAMLATLRLPPMVFTPFVVIILLSLLTPRNSQESLDRYYVKMKTPVEPEPEADQRELEESYANPQRYDDKKLLPGTNVEILRPNMTDILGFVLSVLARFAIIGILVWVTKIGS